MQINYTYFELEVFRVQEGQEGYDVIVESWGPARSAIALVPGLQDTK